MEVDLDFESHVMSAIKAADERAISPATRAVELARLVQAKGLGLPSPELGLVLVGNICFANNTPSFWKLLEHSIASRFISPLHALALLTARVIPHRKAQPEAYRLYLELLSRYIFASSPMGLGSCREKIIMSIDDVLQLSHMYVVHKLDFGHTVLLFHFNVIIRLIDATLEDWGFQLTFTDRYGSISSNEDHMVMDVDANRLLVTMRNESDGHLSKTNALLALEVVEKITATKEAKALLRLMQLNMPEKFKSLLQRLQFIEAHQSTSQSLIFANEILLRLFANIQKAKNVTTNLDKHQLTGVLVNLGSCDTTFCHTYGLGRTACWISIDIFMEKTMDEKHVHTASAIEVLTELTKTLRVINQATWQETFQALWVSALRLVQRDREPMEGPVPHLDARLCVLLSIVPLAILHVVKEEEDVLASTKSEILMEETAGCEQAMSDNMQGSRRHGLVLSLQLLGKFSSLLSPPSSVVVAANMAAVKAATFISNMKKGSDSFGGDKHSTASAKAVGNMLHLIVEACMARKLIDTTAYFWPGYVDTFASLVDSKLVQESPWSTFMKGASLTSSLRNALAAIPASSITELERLYHIALHGSEEEKSAAAKILCGASLIRGWNIQEHTVYIVIKLLSPPVPAGCSKDGSHLISYKSMLYSILLGLSCADVVHIFSLYGMIPEVAAALMPLCETFGSLSPSSDHRSSTSNESSAYSVFSCAFLFLLRLWKFYGPSYEQCLAGRGGTVKMQLTLNYLLLIHNSRISSENCTAMDGTLRFKELSSASSGQPVCIDSFPNLRAWYFQNQACIASTLDGLSSKIPVHQVANKILNMICQKMTKAGTVSDNLSSTTSSGSSAPHSVEDAQRPMLPAWEILEAVPFVLEAVLSACAHGRLSSRELTTGLRDLVDFLPASLATIISYFSAETTRGIWKHVLMNGIDWPSPAANLVSFESEVEEILKNVGVQLPSSYSCGTKPAMLPLPIAAFVSLTITFKVDKSLDYIHGVAGQALENSAIGCLWPGMPIIGALWSQKVRRWHDFIVLMCARSLFTQDKEAVAQLTRSCFSSFIGSSPVDFHHMTHRGVNGLLGQAFTDQRERLPVSPGTLYLRSCRSFHDAHFISDMILRLVVERAREPANSFAIAAERARAVATLGASLLCIAGGVQVVQVLYEETLPTFLLSGKEGDEDGRLRYESHVLGGGYGMACMVLFSGALVWGVGKVSPVYSSIFYSKRARVVGTHVDFITGVVEGKVQPRCDIAMLRAYVLCLVSLMVRFVPGWVSDVKPETLRRLANGLRGWGEGDLALALLERGGSMAVELVVESLL